MKALTLALLALFAADHARSSAAPDPADLAQAISTFTGKRVEAADIRQIHCADIAEEPTEFSCSWRQRSETRWRSYTIVVALDGRGWLLIDEPALSR